MRTLSCQTDQFGAVNPLCASSDRPWPSNWIGELALAAGARFGHGDFIQQASLFSVIVATALTVR
jgi:hypothetical protein